MSKNWLNDKKQITGINGQFSQWKELSSRFPQGSVLGLVVLFNLFISDLELEVSSIVAKFLDNTRLFRKVKTKGD